MSAKVGSDNTDTDIAYTKGIGDGLAENRVSQSQIIIGNGDIDFNGNVIVMTVCTGRRVLNNTPVHAFANRIING